MGCALSGRDSSTITMTFKNVKIQYLWNSHSLSNNCGSCQGLRNAISSYSNCQVQVIVDIDQGRILACNFYLELKICYIIELLKLGNIGRGLC